MNSSSLSRGIWRGGQCNFRQSKPLLSHFLAGASKGGPQAVREPEHPAKGDGSRFAREPALPSASGSQIHGLKKDLNKLPIRGGAWHSGASARSSTD
jgi:hypothetical protein